ncbi:PAS domain-containing protein [Mucilaginibacter sp. JRF]|uniref:PAS domain-containing protein n=1 Tax=Mucilaginibacter sp. JRF TaxID=2780088 RepID=UPI00187E39B1|nr:PAS domain-containing protein [Mucilaginibacter sp. JRF]MBE9583357.1 PAS domain-containing protein [Mucilaginibacter sp. JRF]
MKFNDATIVDCFKSPQPVILLRADAPNFTILAYNNAYKEATYTHFRDITGWYLWEAFNPNFAGGDGAAILIEALDTALSTKNRLSTKVFQYNIPLDNSGHMAECWWQIEILPVENVSGEITQLLIKTNKVDLAAE